MEAALRLGLTGIGTVLGLTSGAGADAVAGPFGIDLLARLERDEKVLAAGVLERAARAVVAVPEFHRIGAAERSDCCVAVDALLARCPPDPVALIRMRPLVASGSRAAVTEAAMVLASSVLDGAAADEILEQHHLDMALAASIVVALLEAVLLEGRELERLRPPCEAHLAERAAAGAAPGTSPAPSADIRGAREAPSRQEITRLSAAHDVPEALVAALAGLNLEDPRRDLAVVVADAAGLVASLAAGEGAPEVAGQRLASARALLTGDMDAARAGLAGAIATAMSMTMRDPDGADAHITAAVLSCTDAAQLATLIHDHMGAVGWYLQACDLLGDAEPRLRWRLVMRLIEALARQAEVHDDLTALEDAIAAHDEALHIALQGGEPADWVTTQISRGDAVVRLADRTGSRSRLMEALAAYREAERDGAGLLSPEDFARLQASLGLVLLRVGDKDKDLVSLAAAADTLRQALPDPAPAGLGGKVPTATLALQVSHGDALRMLAEQADDAALRAEALAVFERALALISREDAPLLWARATIGLARLHAQVAEQAGDISSARGPIRLFEEALASFGPAEAADLWATAQGGLGAALLALAEFDDSIEHLEQAAYAFQSALDAQPREQMPFDWAMMQSNLAIALRMIGERQKDEPLLWEAVSARRAAREVFAELDLAELVEASDQAISALYVSMRPLQPGTPHDAAGAGSASRAGAA